jgi:hypothetical protein
MPGCEAPLHTRVLGQGSIAVLERVGEIRDRLVASGREEVTNEEHFPHRVFSTFVPANMGSGRAANCKILNSLINDIHVGNCSSTGAEVETELPWSLDIER